MVGELVGFKNHLYVTVLDTATLQHFNPHTWYIHVSKLADFIECLSVQGGYEMTSHPKRNVPID